MNNNTVSQEKKHSSKITMIEFNPNSKQLLTADEGGVLVVWNVQMGLLRFNCEQQKTGSIDHCIFQTNFNEKAYEMLFSFGGSNGHIQLAQLNNVCPEICKVGGGIKSLLYYKEDNSVIIISSRLLMVKFKAAFDKNIVPDRKVKLSISGDPETLVSIWAGKGLLATTASEKIIRMWNLKQDENYNLSLSNTNFEDRITNDLFTNISYCPKSKTLAACTNTGKIVFFKSKLEELSPRSEEHWDLMYIYLPEKQMQYNYLTWCKSEGESILSAFSTEKIVSLKENNLKINYNCGNLVVQKELTKFFIVQSELTNTKSNKEYDDQITTKITNPRGFDSQKKTFAVWDDKAVEVWEVILSNKMKKMNGRFELGPFDQVKICNNHLVTLASYTVTVYNQRGEVVKEIRQLENEGKPKLLKTNGEFFVVVTSTNLIKIFEIDKKPEVRQKSLSRQFVDPNNKSLGNVRDIAVNNECSKISILSTDSFGIDQKKVFIYNVDSDSFMSQGYERNETLLNMQWDLVDARLFSLQIETKNEKDYYEFKSRCETYFVTTENGISSYETVEYKGNQKNLIGVKTPHLIFENNFTLKEIEEEQNTVSSMRYTNTLMRDYENINTEIDETLKSSLLDFSQQLTCGNLDEAQKSIRLINNRVIWEKMTQMCIKKRTINVLEVCLANMRFLRGAQALREAKAKYAEPEAHLAMVAIHLNMIDEAKELLVECKRYDILNEMFQSSAMFEEAIEVAHKNDRINLKNTYANYVSFLEITENQEEAEKYQDKISQNPTKKLDEMLKNPQVTTEEVEQQLETKNLFELYKQQAEQLESHKHEQEGVKKQQELASDQTSVVRITIASQDLDAAIKLCMDQNNASAQYFLAKVLEENEHVQQAIEFYKKSGRTSKAIKLAKEHHLDEEVIRLSLTSSDRDSMLISAQHFEQKNQYEQAVLLQNKCGQQSKAVEMCFKFKLFDKLKAILEDLKEFDDANMLTKVADFFMSNSEFEKAVGIQLKLGQAEQAMALVQQHDVPVDDEMADLLTPELGAVEHDRRNEVLIEIGRIAKRQQNFALAAKKFTQAGAKLKAIKALIQVGNLDKVITFAQTARDAECYILAGNQLQTTDWHNDAKIMTNIINFYTKAKSYEQLAGFYELCSWVEIDEYRDYEKALSALNQALKLYNKNDSRDKSSQVEKRIKVVERFVEARNLEQTDQSQMVDICKQLLQTDNADSFLRVGDVYSQLVEYYYNYKDQRSAYGYIEQMKKKNIIMDPYLDKQLVNDIYKQLNIKVDEDSDIEEDLDNM